MEMEIKSNAELDCVGLFCPMPIARTKEEIENIEVGQILKVEADDPAAEEDIKRWAKRAGHEVVGSRSPGMCLRFGLEGKNEISVIGEKHEQNTLRSDQRP